MAKGDASAVQNQINTQTGTAQQNLNNLRNQNAAMTGGLSNLFGRAVTQPTGPGGTGDIFTGYGNFAQTGGFSPEDISAMQQQATAPAQGAFEGARNQIMRNAAVQGNAPNTAAALSRLGRQESQSLGSLGTQAMGNIAQLQQQGKLYGLGGLSNLSNMFGNQVLQSAGQGLQGQQLQNQIAQMAIQGQLGKAQVPGDFQQAMGNVSSFLKPIGTLGGALGSIFTGGASGALTPAMMGMGNLSGYQQPVAGLDY